MTEENPARRREVQREIERAEDALFDAFDKIAEKFGLDDDTIIEAIVWAEVGNDDAYREYMDERNRDDLDARQSAEVPEAVR